MKRQITPTKIIAEGRIMEILARFPKGIITTEILGELKQVDTKGPVTYWLHNLTPHEVGAILRKFHARGLIEIRDTKKLGPPLWGERRIWCLRNRVKRGSRKFQPGQALSGVA